MGTCRYPALVSWRALRQGSPQARRSRLLAALCTVFTLLVVGVANADPLPPYDGTMSFRSIEGPSGPENFSWQVSLSEDQVLEQIDDQTAQVFWVPGHEPAFTINATLAHDAIGTNVPTSLAVSDGDVITLYEEELQLTLGNISTLQDDQAKVTFLNCLTGCPW